ncbi:DUF2502 domain-containing protein [Yersinia ruckeri]|uniref:DUF2502 domain-containing protein n=1 Tax=Yersinia ruckeri TaxID=29486 RepID=UPI002237DC1B|nr:DUF2502 domain-containing protein [Yersinia ruckeri]MCW6569344.1 DUF2502 domain-containing protein [Yersinia ruckeri]
MAPSAKAVSINLLPGISLQIGEQDKSGNYWDGHRWRDKVWWKKNYYYHDGRYWKYDKKAYKKYKKSHHKHHHDHDHDD